MKKNFIIVMLVLTSAIQALGKMAKMDCVDYVNPLVGTESKFELSCHSHAMGYEFLDAPDWQDGRWVGVCILARQDTRIQADSPAKSMD